MHCASCHGARGEGVDAVSLANPNLLATASDGFLQYAILHGRSGTRMRPFSDTLPPPQINDVVAFVRSFADGAAAVEPPPEEAPDPRPDAVLIGCFGDPGLMALRESSPAPVTGLAEAAFIEAARHGRYTIVTGGERWGPMLQRLAQALGQAQQLAGIHTVVPTGAQLAADPAAAHRLLAQACRDAAHQLGVQAVILGGAGLAGMAATIQSDVPVPVIDSVTAGTHWALRTPPLPPARRTPGFDIAWEGLSPEMLALAPAA
jgi:Asp/Glu/hydantoin racemase